MFDRGGQIFHLLAAMFHLKGQNPTKNIKCLIAEVKFGSDEFGIQGRERTTSFIPLYLNDPFVIESDLVQRFFLNPVKKRGWRIFSEANPA